MSRRYRIAMVAACPFPAARGTPIRIFRIADEIARRGHAVDVYAYHLGDPVATRSFRIHRIRDVGFYTRTAPGPSYAKLLLLDPLLALELAKGLRRTRYDVIHAHHVEGLLSVLPTRIVRRVPTVFDVHTLLESELPSYPLGFSRRLAKRVGRGFDRGLPRFADHVIAVSDAIRDGLVAGSGVAADSVSVVPNGVEPEFLEAKRPAESSGPSRKPSLVYAGGLAPYHGIDFLLAAFAQARRSRPDLTLKIITSSSFAAFESLATRLGVRDHIEVSTATLEELPNRLARADAALNPRAKCEGMPQKLLNYAAVGCAVVSFAGSARFLEHEQTGLVVPDGDTAKFAEAMLRLVADRALAHRLGDNARAFVRKELSWAHAVERFEEIYERLTHGTSPGS